MVGELKTGILTRKQYILMTLHYNFPFIENVSDVLPHIEGHPEFIVVKKDKLTVINYAFQSSETFPPVTDAATAMLRECRGLIFDTETGAIKSRPFHKFFNLGEKTDTTEIDVSKGHSLLDKLDGSMIRPVQLGEHIRWASKMGITDVSMQAEVFVATHADYQKFAQACLRIGLTPIFEWMSTKNRIVIDYGPDKLVLLALRNMLTGAYTERQAVVTMGGMYDIPVVETVSYDFNAIRQLENIEGVVVLFDDGHMVKCKTDWYVSLHRAKAEISSERLTIRVILEDKVDDLLPVLPEDDRKKLLDFRDAVWHDIAIFGEAVFTVMKMIRKEGWNRKEFALRSEDFYHPPIRAAIFHLFIEPYPLIRSAAQEWGKRFILKNLGNRSALEKAQTVLSTARWKEVVE